MGEGGLGVLEVVCVGEEGEAHWSLLSGQDAKKDDAVRKAYKYLAALHEVSGGGCWGLAGVACGGGASLLLLPSPELQPAHPDH